MQLGNTTLRIIISIAAIPFIIAVSYFGRIPFLLFALGIGLLSYYEFASLTVHKNDYANKPAGYIAVFLLILNSYFRFIETELLFLIITVLLLLVELFRNKESAINNLGATLLGIFYVGYFSAVLVQIREFYNRSDFLYAQGGFIIIAMFFTIWICDSAAFFLGSAYGKHKLFPRVSPNKSWEGAIAGFVFSILAMIVSKETILDFLGWNDVIILGIIIGTIGQIGDLIESLIKRDAKVKDSSSLIPGHGGMFDRFDSLLFSAPVIFLYLHYFV